MGGDKGGNLASSPLSNAPRKRRLTDLAPQGLGVHALSLAADAAYDQAFTNLDTAAQAVIHALDDVTCGHVLWTDYQQASLQLLIADTERAERRANLEANSRLGL